MLFLKIDNPIFYRGEVREEAHQALVNPMAIMTVRPWPHGGSELVVKPQHDHPTCISIMTTMEFSEIHRLLIELDRRQSDGVDFSHIVFSAN